MPCSANLRISNIEWYIARCREGICNGDVPSKHQDKVYRQCTLILALGGRIKKHGNWNK